MATPTYTRETFDARLNKDGPIPSHAPWLGNCWIWRGNKGSHGYGSTSFKNKAESVHRISFQLFFRPLEKGEWVLHKCDNRGCCRPDHLFVGDREANLRDMIAKGRHKGAVGIRNGSAKLTPELVREIREKYRTRVGTHEQLAGQYNVSRETIQGVTSRRYWKNV